MEEEEACEVNEDSLLGWIDMIDFKKGVYCRECNVGCSL
jgi:hypothetical protein